MFVCWAYSMTAEERCKYAVSQLDQLVPPTDFTRRSASQGFVPDIMKKDDADYDDMRNRAMRLQVVC